MAKGDRKFDDQVTAEGTLINGVFAVTNLYIAQVPPDTDGPSPLPSVEPPEAPISTWDFIPEKYCGDGPEFNRQLTSVPVADGAACAALCVSNPSCRFASWVQSQAKCGLHELCKQYGYTGQGNGIYVKPAWLSWNQELGKHCSLTGGAVDNVGVDTAAQCLERCADQADCAVASVVVAQDPAAGGGEGGLLCALAPSAYDCDPQATQGALHFSRPGWEGWEMLEGNCGGDPSQPNSQLIAGVAGLFECLDLCEASPVCRFASYERTWADNAPRVRALCPVQ